MYKTPYETSGMVVYDNKANIELIEHELVRDESLFAPAFTDYEYANRNIKCINHSDGLEKVGILNLPLLVERDTYNQEDDRKVFLVDMRPFVSVDKSGKVNVSKISAYQNNLIIAVLSDIWYKKGPKSLTVNNKVPLRVFTRWITNILGKRLNIDEIAQVRVSAIVAFYFLCLFNDLPKYEESKYLSDDEAYVYAVKVSYATGLSTADALNIITSIPTMQTVQDLTHALRDHSGSDRCRQLNVAVLYNLLGRNTLNGLNRDAVYCSLEYPPIFFAMVYIAAKHRGYNKSDIGDFVHQIRNMDDVKHFVKSVDLNLNDS